MAGPWLPLQGMLLLSEDGGGEAAQGGSGGPGKGPGRLPLARRRVRRGLGMWLCWAQELDAWRRPGPGHMWGAAGMTPGPAPSGRWPTLRGAETMLGRNTRELQLRAEDENTDSIFSGSYIFTGSSFTKAAKIILRILRK